MKLISELHDFLRDGTVFHRDAPENEKLALKRSILGLGRVMRERERQRERERERRGRGGGRVMRKRERGEVHKHHFVTVIFLEGNTEKQDFTSVHISKVLNQLIQLTVISYKRQCD